MTEAGRSIQTLVVTEAVRDATIGGKKVKRGQTIALDPDDGLVASTATGSSACPAAVAALTPGFELLTLFYGDGADLAEAETMARTDRRRDARSRGGGPPRWTAVLPLPDRRRVGVAKAAQPGHRRRPTRSSCCRPRWRGPGWPPGPRCAGPGSGSASTTSATSCSTCLAGTTTCARCASSATCSSSPTGTSSRPWRPSAMSGSSPASAAGPSGRSPGSRTTRARSTRRGSVAGSSSGGSRSGPRWSCPGSSSTSADA